MTEPVLTIVKGSPTAEELAALVVVLLSTPSPTPPAPTPTSGWSAYWRGVRAPLDPGPGAWRAAGRR